MKLQEIYRTQLINNLKLVNVVLGLQNIGNPSIIEFLEESYKSYKNICRNKDDKTKAISVILELSSEIMIISEDCSFYNLSLVDFRSYDRIDFLLDKVLKFTSYDGIRNFIKEDFKLVIGYLTIIERELGDNIKDTLSYTIIRNFLVFCHLGLFRYAYYYAMFIRSQIFISEGLNPRIEYTDLYRSELSLAIKNERKNYSKAIKRKITGGIKDVVNKVPLVNIKDKRDDRFIGESSSLAVDGKRSVDSVNESVLNVIEDAKKKKKEQEKTVGETIKQSRENLAEGSKVVSEKVVDTVADSVKKPIEAVKKPLTKVSETVKDSIGEVKSKVDVKFGLKDESIDEELKELESLGKEESPKEKQDLVEKEEKPKSAKRSSINKIRNRRNKKNKIDSNLEDEGNVIVDENSDEREGLSNSKIFG